MTVTVDAVWKDGVLRPKQPVPLPEGTDVRISIDVPEADDRDPLSGVIGIGDGPEAGDAADFHDRSVRSPTSQIRQTAGLLKWNGDPKALEHLLGPDNTPWEKS